MSLSVHRRIYERAGRERSKLSRSSAAAAPPQTTKAKGPLDALFSACTTLLRPLDITSIALRHSSSASHHLV